LVPMDSEPTGIANEEKKVGKNVTKSQKLAEQNKGE